MECRVSIDERAHNGPIDPPDYTAEITECLLEDLAKTGPTPKWADKLYTAVNNYAAEEAFDEDCEHIFGWVMVASASDECHAGAIAKSYLDKCVAQFVERHYSDLVSHYITE